MNKSLRDRFILILIALIIIGIGALLFVGNDMLSTLERWWIASMVMGGIYGLISIDKLLARFFAKYLALVYLVSIVILVITRAGWLHTCWPALWPITVLGSPLLAVLAGFFLGFILKSISIIQKSVIKEFDDPAQIKRKETFLDLDEEKRTISEFCDNCGKKLEPGVATCPNCGK